MLHTCPKSLRLEVLKPRVQIRTCGAPPDLSQLRLLRSAGDVLLALIWRGPQQVAIISDGPLTTRRRVCSPERAARLTRLMFQSFVRAKSSIVRVHSAAVRWEAVSVQTLTWSRFRSRHVVAVYMCGSICYLCRSSALLRCCPG